MRKFLFFLIFCLTGDVLLAQVRPDQTPIQLNPTNANWEFYSQKGGTSLRRCSVDSLGRNFRLEYYSGTSYVLPSGNPAPLRNRLVRTPGDSVFLVDFYGIGFLVSKPGGGGGSVLTTAPIVGNGTSGNRVRIDTSGATAGQSLVFNGSAWTASNAGVYVTGSLTGSGTPLLPLNVIDGGITGAKLAANAVSDSTKIAAGAVSTTDIADGAVFANKLATNAVSTAKIQNSAVTNVKIANDAVDSTKVKPASIANSDLAGGVTLSKLGQSGAAINQVPQWNGSAWVPVTVSGGGGSPGGSNNQIQYNLLGTFAGSSKMVFNSSADTIGLGGSVRIQDTLNAKRIIFPYDKRGVRPGGYAAISAYNSTVSGTSVIDRLFNIGINILNGNTINSYPQNSQQFEVDYLTPNLDTLSEWHHTFSGRNAARSLRALFIKYNIATGRTDHEVFADNYNIRWAANHEGGSSNTIFNFSPMLNNASFFLRANDTKKSFAFSPTGLVLDSANLRIIGRDVTGITELSMINPQGTLYSIGVRPSTGYFQVQNDGSHYLYMDSLGRQAINGAIGNMVEYYAPSELTSCKIGLTARSTGSAGFVLNTSNGFAWDINSDNNRNLNIYSGRFNNYAAYCNGLNGNWAFVNGVTTTAKIHIGAGTATANTAPLKFTSGTNLSTPENGAIEYNGTDVFQTSGGIRYALVKTNSNFTEAITLPSGTTAQRPTAAAGVIRHNTDLNKFEGVGAGATYYPFVQTLFSSTSNAVVSNTTAITSLASVSIAANSLAAGQTLRINLEGFMSTLSPTPGKGRIGIVYGTDTIYSANDFLRAVTGSKTVVAEFTIRVSASGASGAVRAQGFFNQKTDTTDPQLFGGWFPITTPTTSNNTVDTTSTKTLSVFWQWATADINNSISITNAVIKRE